MVLSEYKISKLGYSCVSCSDSKYEVIPFKFFSLILEKDET